MHSTLNTKQYCASNPYYPQAQGIDLECYRKVSNGSIAFTIMDADPSINALLNNSLVARGDAFNNNKQCGAIDCLNGLGDGMRSNWQVMAKIVVLGIVEQGGVNEYFNVIRQGIITVMNNGDQTIQNGDDVVAYAPTPDELENSGLKTRELANGVAHLWFRPFDRNRHSTLPHGVLPCMQALAVKNEAELRGYLPPFKRLCQSLERGVRDVAVVVIGVVGRERVQEILDNTVGDGDAGLLNGLVDEMETAAFRARLPNYLFPAQSARGQWLERGERAASDLNKLQAQACGRYMRALQDMAAEIDRCKVGRALSTSLPGMPLLLQVNK
jgi:hypothetical protein